MTSPDQMTSEDQLLLQLATLSAEIHECIAHIACNDLHALEESLWRQELLITTLVSVLDHRVHRTGPAPAGPVLQSLANALLSANREYCQLLTQVGQENSRLLQLACEYGDDAEMQKARYLKHLVEA